MWISHRANMRQLSYLLWYQLCLYHRVIMKIKRDQVHDSKEELNKQDAFYSKIILILSTIHCLASSSNSRRSKIERATDRLMWLPSEATSHPWLLRVLYSWIWVQGPQWQMTFCIQVDKGHSSAAVNMWLCFQTRPTSRMHHQPPLLRCIAMSVHSSIHWEKIMCQALAKKKKNRSQTKPCPHGTHTKGKSKY